VEPLPAEKPTKATALIGPSRLSVSVVSSWG